MILLLFFSILFIGLLSAIYLLTALNPISRLIYLIVIFVMSSFLYLLLDFYFLGLTYIIVYVGAIAILFLFIIMMSEKAPDRFTNKNVFGIKNSALSYSNSLEILSRVEPHNTISSYKNLNLRYFLIVLFSLLSLLLLPFNSSIISLLPFNPLELNAFNNNLNDSFHLYNYFVIDYSIDFINFTDLNVLGFILYLAYPFITLILAILLWIVLIGILKISSP